MNERGQINISIAGTVFIALALFGVMSLGIGIAFNEIKAGSGDLLVNMGIASFVILVILVIATWILQQQQQQ